MSRRADFIAAARSMIGTRFHHQGRLPGVGLDCAGLVVCAAHSAGIDLADEPGYGHMPHSGTFMAKVAENADRIDPADVMPGDMMVFAFRGEPQHVAIVSAVTPRILLLHAYAEARRVVENGFDGIWQSRLRGCWRLRGLD
jgi:cell wall-associated NlpC family hydrolase